MKIGSFDNPSRTFETGLNVEGSTKNTELFRRILLHDPSIKKKNNRLFLYTKKRKKLNVSFCANFMHDCDERLMFGALEKFNVL